MNIHTLDLNLFLVFRAVYQTGSVTLGGDRVGLTQSAASNALKRLRERFNDPLFVRTAEGMVPTPLAQRLIVPVEEGLTRLAQGIEQGRQFDAASSDRSFRIVINDIGQWVMMPRLLAAAKEAAPGVRFETIDASLPEARHAMVHGQADLAVGSWRPMGPTFFQQRLFDETFVALMSADHPLAARDMGVDDYLAAEHIAYRPSGSTDAELQNALQRVGVLAQRRVVLTAAHSLGLPAILAGSRMLLTAPSRLAHAILDARPDLRLAPLPFDVTPFAVRQQWHERFQHDSGNRWLRQLFMALFHQPSARQLVARTPETVKSDAADALWLLSRQLGRSVVAVASSKESSSLRDRDAHLAPVTEGTLTFDRAGSRSEHV